jgi:hypothetical protein
MIYTVLVVAVAFSILRRLRLPKRTPSVSQVTVDPLVMARSLDRIAKLEGDLRWNAEVSRRLAAAYQRGVEEAELRIEQIYQQVTRGDRLAQ